VLLQDYFIAHRKNRPANSGPTLLYLALGLTGICDESLKLDMTNIVRWMITEISNFCMQHSHTLTIQIWWQRVTFRWHPAHLTLTVSVPLGTVHTKLFPIFIYIYFFFMARQPLVGQGLIVETPRSYSDTPHGRSPLDEW
jgi:hypothetical protein